MSYIVTQENILSIPADAAVVSLQQTMGYCGEPVSHSLSEAGGDVLRGAVRQLRFLPVGSARAVDVPALPFQKIILAVPPRYLTGKANELLILQRLYEEIYAAAESADCRSLAMPFLSAWYYRFPAAEAVHIALQSAGKHSMETVFIADAELAALAKVPYHRPQITAYVGWYRSHAYFSLDNGLYARVDLRPELREVSVIPYIEPCCRLGNNPLQEPLSEQEISRLRRIYEEAEG